MQGKIETIASTADANASIAIQGGALATSTGMFAQLIIFTDNAYMYLAIVGAMVSMFGVLHELYGNGKSQENKMFIFTQLLRGLALGILAIPFWFLMITEGMLGHISGFDVGDVSNSLALIISFAMSWYTIPIFDWITEKVRKKAEDV